MEGTIALDTSPSPATDTTLHPITLHGALTNIFCERLEMDEDDEENDGLGQREQDLRDSVVYFDDERDALTAIDYVLSFLLEARDKIIEHNGHGDETTLSAPKYGFAKGV